jgi:hypothetical protein
MSFWL